MALRRAGEDLHDGGAAGVVPELRELAYEVVRERREPEREEGEVCGEEPESVRDRREVQVVDRAVLHRRITRQHLHWTFS